MLIETVEHNGRMVSVQDDGHMFSVWLDGGCVMWTTDYRMVGDSELTRRAELREWLTAIDPQSGSGAESAYTLPRDLFYACEDYAGNADEWRFFDNGGETIDRYSIWQGEHGGAGHWLGCSEYPFHPQGFGQHSEGDHPDAIGMDDERELSFDDLPRDVRRAVLQDAGLG